MSRLLALWSYLQDNEIRILLSSQKLDLPKKFLGSIQKQVLKNDRLRWLYPVLLQVDRQYTKSSENTWSSEQCVLPRHGIPPDPTFQAIGITGAAQGGHYDLIIPDDMVGEKGMESALVMADALRWWDNIDELKVQPIKTLPNASRIRGLGTHWCVGDMSCYIQEKYENVKWMIAPALKDTSLQDAGNITWIQDPDAHNGESNWEEEFTTDHYKEMLANPEKQLVFWAQHMNNPRASPLTDFKEVWLRYYEPTTVEDKPAIKFVDRLDREVYALMPDFEIKATIDPAFSESGVTKASRTAIVVVGVHKKTGLKFVFEAWAKRVTEPRHLYEQVMKFHLKYRPRRWGCEAFQAQAFVLKGIREYFMDKKTYIPITALDKDVGRDAKKLRIRSLIDEFGTGQVFILKTMLDFKAEYLASPAPGFTNDIIDALAYHKKWWSNVDQISQNEEMKRRKLAFQMEVGQRKTGY